MAGYAGAPQPSDPQYAPGFKLKILNNFVVKILRYWMRYEGSAPSLYQKCSPLGLNSRL